MVLAFWLTLVFVSGASVGSFLNVAIARLPLEKSLLWPNSRCGACLRPIEWYDNLPILSYLWLRGRCRACGQSYSPAYLFVELGAGLGFTGLFALEIIENIFAWPGHVDPTYRLFFFPWGSLCGFAWHATLFSFLLIATVCDLKSREIPLQLTLTGTLIGLVGSALLPWPFPHAVPAPAGTLPEGAFPWPFWDPLPGWCGEGGNWQTGLITGILGALCGTLLLRAVGSVFSAGLGKEALGLGDADLMMMAGSFLGWQVVAVAFFLSVLPALLFGIMQLIVRRDNSLPFGPSLSLSVMATYLVWQPIGAYVRPVIHWGEVLFWGVIVCGALMFLMSFGLRVLRGKEEEST